MCTFLQLQFLCEWKRKLCDIIVGVWSEFRQIFSRNFSKVELFKNRNGHNFAHTKNATKLWTGEIMTNHHYKLRLLKCQYFTKFMGVNGFFRSVFATRALKISQKRLFKLCIKHFPKCCKKCAAVTSIHWWIQRYIHCPPKPLFYATDAHRFMTCNRLLLCRC